MATVAVVDGQEITQPELDAATQRRAPAVSRRLFGGQIPGRASTTRRCCASQALDQIDRAARGGSTRWRSQNSVSPSGTRRSARAIRELPDFLDTDGELRSGALPAAAQARSSRQPDSCLRGSRLPRRQAALNQFSASASSSTGFTLPDGGGSGWMRSPASSAPSTRCASTWRQAQGRDRAVRGGSDRCPHFEENADSLHAGPPRARIAWLELVGRHAGRDDMDVVDEEDARDWYDEPTARQLHDVPSQRDASHILFSVDDAGDADAVAAASASGPRLARRPPSASRAARTFADAGHASCRTTPGRPCRVAASASSHLRRADGARVFEEALAALSARWEICRSRCAPISGCT